MAPQAKAPNKFDFDIPALPLYEAVIEFALARELEVVFIAGIAEGKTANPLQGEYTLPEALNILFANTGLHARFTTERSISIIKRPAQRKPLKPSLTRKKQAEKKDITIDIDDAIEEVVVVAKLISPYRLDVTSSSTKTQRSPLDTPQIVNAVSEQLIYDTALRDYTDVSQLASSVDFLEASSGVTRELRLRGFAYPSLKLDGYSSHAYIRAPDLAFVERVEIAKGPSSALYGRMEPGGVINMKLKRPDFKRNYRASLWLDNKDFQRSVLDITDELNEGLWFRAILFDQREGERSLFNQNDNQGISLTLEKDLEGGASLSFNYRLEREQAARRFGSPANQLAQEIQLAETDGTFILIDSIREDLKTIVDIDTHTLQLMLENVDLGGWGINAQMQYDLYKSTSVVRYPTIDDDVIIDLTEALQEVEEAAEDESNPDAFEEALEALELAAENLDIQPDDIGSFEDIIDNKARFFSGEATAVKNLEIHDTDIEQLYGINISRTKPQQLVLQNHDTRGTFNIEENFLTIDNSDQPIDVTELNLAAFTQWIFDLNQYFTVFLGGRYDYIDLEADSDPIQIDRTIKAFSGRIGATLSLFDNTSFYTNYSESFTPQFIRRRIPSTDEDVEETFTLSIPPPSRSRQIELGWKREWRQETLQTSCAIYFIEKKEIVARTQEQRNKGYECDMTGKLGKGWDVALSFNHLDAEIRESSLDIQGNTPRVTPDTVAKFWLSYARPWDSSWASTWSGNAEIGLGIGGRYVSDRFADDQNEVIFQAYKVLDLSVFYRLQNSLQINLNLKNALDERYDEGAFDNSPFWVTRGPSRSLGISLDYMF